MTTDTGFTIKSGLPVDDLVAIDANSRIVTKPFSDILPDQTGHSGEFLQTDGAGTLSWAAASGGSGTVTSVDLTAPTEFSVTGNPVTTSGTLAIAWASGAQNKVLATPDGSAGVPSLRALVAADIPSLSYEVPLTFSTGLTRATNTITVNTSQNIAKLSNLTSNGFVKTGSGDGTLSIDTSTYLTAAGAVTSITGTANQVIASASTGAVTLSTPQSIATSSTPQFARIGLGVAADATAIFYGNQSIAANTVVDGFILENPTAATSGNQRYSPAIHLKGYGWGTSAGASQPADWRIYNKPVQGAVTTTQLWFSANNAASGYFDVMGINMTGGGSALSGIISASAGLLTSNPLLTFSTTTGLLSKLSDALTNTTADGLTLAHNATGTQAAGFGTRLLFNLESSTTTDQNAIGLTALWTDATHASRTAALVFSGVNNATAIAEWGRLKNGVLTIGVAGTLLGQVSLSGNTSGTATIQSAAAAGSSTYTIRDQGANANFVLSNVTGGNANCGQATLVGGTKVVNTTFVQANSLIFLTNTSGANAMYAGTIVAGTSFTITGTGTDVINWLIINQ